MIKLKEYFRKGFVKAYYKAADLLYHDFAWAYDSAAWLVSFGFWSQWRLDALNYLIPGSILETGFGTGSLLIEMVKQGLDVIGLERSPQMHNVTGRKLKRNNLLVQRVLGGTEAIPFPKGSFSNVLSTFPSNYVFSKDTCVQVQRVLEGSGRWVIAGLGMAFKSGIKQKLTSWVWGKFDSDLIKQMAEKMKTAGFSYSIILHETAQYRFPILILEPHDG